MTSQHAVGADALPRFTRTVDRLLLAQAIAEGISLLTADAKLACYAPPVRKV